MQPTDTIPYSDLRKTSRIDLVAHSPLPVPLTIYVEPTNICNFRCVYCPESFPDFEERSGGLHRMDLVAFSRIIGQVLAMGRLKMLNFYMMGEPFANRALPEFIALATSKQVAERISVTTNGTLIDEKTADRIIDSGLDYLRVSIYGATQKSFARRTGSRVPLHRIVDNIAALRQRREARQTSTPFIYVKMIDSGDEAENALFREKFAALGDEVVIEPVMNWNDPEGQNLAQVPREEMLLHTYFQHRKRVCPLPFYTLIIHSDLQVSVCCVDWANSGLPTCGTSATVYRPAPNALISTPRRTTSTPWTRNPI